MQLQAAKFYAPSRLKRQRYSLETETNSSLLADLTKKDSVKFNLCGKKIGFGWHRDTDLTVSNLILTDVDLDEKSISQKSRNEIANLTVSEGGTIEKIADSFITPGESYITKPT